MKNHRKKIILALVIAIALGLAVFHWGTKKSDDQSQAENEERLCAQDARQCPDGSYVGRVAPSCEFAACPNEAEIPEGAVFEDGTLPPNRGDVQSENMSIEGAAQGELDQDMVNGR